jgi:hypothetical protein
MESIMQTRERALTENYAAFERMLPKLLNSDAGRYVLLRNQELAGVFDSAATAHAAGRSRFDDGLFSVQKVKEGTISLGFFSYARYCGAT